MASAIRLPELPQTDGAVGPQCLVELGMVPAPADDSTTLRNVWIDDRGRVTLSASRIGDAYCLRVPELATAYLEADGRVVVWPESGVSPATLRHLLVDQFLPRVLAGAGMLMLHAAAVACRDGRALLLLGETGYGKSTLCAALVRAGMRLLNDDCQRLDVVEDRVRVIPSYPGLRLRPDSLAALYGDVAPDVAPVADYLDKLRIAVTDARAVQSGAVASADAGAIIVLRQPGADASITLARMEPSAACMAIVANSFALDPTDMAWVSEQLARAAAVTNRVPVYSLGYPRDYASLPDVVARLRKLTPVARMQA